jgi:hypothetical protein
MPLPEQSDDVAIRIHRAALEVAGSQNTGGERPPINTDVLAAMRRHGFSETDAEIYRRIMLEVGKMTAPGRGDAT